MVPRVHCICHRPWGQFLALYIIPGLCYSPILLFPTTTIQECLCQQQFLTLYVGSSFFRQGKHSKIITVTGAWRMMSVILFCWLKIPCTLYKQLWFSWFIGHSYYSTMYLWRLHWSCIGIIIKYYAKVHYYYAEVLC